MSISKERNIKVIFAGRYNENEILTGPEKVCKRVFSEYAQTEQTVFIDYFRDGSKYGLFKKLFGFEKITEANKSQVMRFGIFRMLIHLYKLNPEIIHILSFERYTSFIFILKLITRCKIYYTANGIIRHENKYYNKESLFSVIKNVITESAIMYLSDIVFYLSDRSKTIILYYYRINKFKLKPARNGLDDCFLKLQEGNVEKEINSIVFIGDLERKEKGGDFLLDALSLVDLSFTLYIITDNKSSSDYQINNLSKVIFIKKLKPLELSYFLLNKNIIVASGEYDQFNIAVLEGISCGMYPVLTFQTGISEIVSSFAECSIVEYGDIKKLSLIISSLISNKVTLKSKPNLGIFRWDNVYRDYYLKHYLHKVC
ncbi:MAG: glycosyltransferase [Ignavibacteria bacterium]